LVTFLLRSLYLPHCFPQLWLLIFKWHCEKDRLERWYICPNLYTMLTPLPDNMADARPFVSIHLENYRKLYYGVLATLAMIVGSSFFLVRYSPYNFSSFTIQRLAVPIMAVLAGLSFAHSYYRKRQLKQIQLLNSFELKLPAYEQLYRFRLLWFLFSGACCSAVYLLSLHRLFLFFALFDAIMLAMHYPNKEVIRKELQNQDILFY